MALEDIKKIRKNRQSIYNAHVEIGRNDDLKNPRRILNNRN